MLPKIFNGTSSFYLLEKLQEVEEKSLKVGSRLELDLFFEISSNMFYLLVNIDKYLALLVG